MSEKKDLSGVWKLLHRLTLNASSNDKDWLIPFIENLCKNTGCQECNKHATAYYKNNNPLNDYNRKGYPGLFEWTVNFHNSVNSRIGKSQISIQEARNLYNKGCTDCDIKTSDLEDINDFIDKKTSTKPIVYL